MAGFEPPHPNLPTIEQLKRLEVERIRAALDFTGGNRSQAAALLGINRTTLVHRLNAAGAWQGIKGAYPKSIPRPVRSRLVKNGRKVCKRCGKWIPVERFYKVARGRYSTLCRRHQAEYMRERTKRLAKICSKCKEPLDAEP